MSEKERAAFYRGIRSAIAYLHEYAGGMNDPHAKAVINTAAYSLGVNKPDPARAPQAGEPKPVAWRYRNIGDERWMVSDDEYFPRMFKANAQRAGRAAEIEPLFAHPPKADPDVVRLAEALKEAIESNINHHHIRSRDGYCERVEEYDTIKRWRAALAPFSALSGEVKQEQPTRYHPEYMVQRLVEAVERAREELRLIRAKDTNAVYDTTLPLDMALALAPFSAKERSHD